MEITTTPVCRVGWKGETLQYVVKAEGATEVLAPAGGPDGLRVQVTGTRQVPGGVEADLEVQVLDSTAY
ncbi:MAG: hypothetical protein QMC79_08590 [Anaerosomatales bacterium]|nr:hypothetical protein [Anaerosomatales bacterium]